MKPTKSVLMMDYNSFYSFAGIELNKESPQYEWNYLEVDEPKEGDASADLDAKPEDKPKEGGDSLEDLDAKRDARDLCNAHELLINMASFCLGCQLKIVTGLCVQNLNKTLNF